MQVPIEDIKVKKRIRKEMGDIAALAESMKRFGQISPIVITKNNILIAGERRLRAAQTLGWRSINAVIADLPGKLAKLEWEMEENLQRRDFAPGELAEAEKQIRRMRNPGFLWRIFNAIVRFFKMIFRIED